MTELQELLDAINGEIFGVWFLIGAALVFWMQAGFAMVEAGFTRAKNTGNILMDRAMQALLTAGTISRETYENAMQVPDMVPQTGQTRVIGMVR